MRAGRSWLAGVAASVVLSMSLTALVAVGPTDASAATPSFPPLASSISTPQGSWAVVAMGDLAQLKNTFWQLFFEAPGSTRWSLVTPTGAADNGGLVSGISAESVVAGIVPSLLLRYSPLAVSTDNGVHWSPVFFPTALAQEPDALAYQAPGSGMGGGALAVTGAGRVLRAPASLVRWTPFVGASTLRTGSGCNAAGVDAVAFSGTGAPIIATGCRGGGTVGLFTRVGSSWHSSAISLNGRLSGSTTRVLRLVTSGSTTSALVAGSGPRGQGLVSLWRTDNGPWSLSATLPFASATRILSSAVSSNGAMTVLVRSPRHAPTPYTISRGGPWIRDPAPPATTETIATDSPVAGTAQSTLEAFAVSGSHLSVFALSATGSTWVRVQTSQIPVAYGSSG